MYALIKEMNFQMSAREKKGKKYHRRKRRLQAGAVMEASLHRQDVNQVLRSKEDSSGQKDEGKIFL